MNASDLSSALEERGALLDGHFRLSSGRHSDRFVQKFRMLEDPSIVEPIAASLAESARAYGPTVVVSAAVGGIVLGYEVARQLGADFKAIFVEKENGVPSLRRGFALGPVDRAFVVEDVVTTGGSVREVLEVVRARGADPVAVGVIVRRQPSDFGVPTIALLDLPVVSYDAAECPQCAKGRTDHRARIAFPRERLKLGARTIDRFRPRSRIDARMCVRRAEGPPLPRAASPPFRRRPSRPPCRSTSRRLTLTVAFPPCCSYTAAGGFTGFEAVAADKIAAHGYVGVALDSIGPGHPGRGPAATEAGDRVEADDARATLAWLRTQPDVDPDRLAVVGFSMGGIAVLDLVDPETQSAAAARLTRRRRVLSVLRRARQRRRRSARDLRWRRR